MSRKLGSQLMLNTLSNYLLLIVNMVSAVFVTRMLLKGLGADFYGFWALLWNIFGYALLLDFGAGIAIQKYTAEIDASGSIRRFERLVTAVSVMYMLTGFIILATALGITGILDSIFIMQPADKIDYYKLVFAVFALCNAMVFPLGIYSEIIAGLKRHDLANLFQIANILVRMAGIWLLFRFGFSLLALAIFANGVNFFTQLGMFLLTRKLLPGFRLRFRSFRFSHLKEIVEFSLFSYIVVVSDLISSNTDRLVLGITLGTGAIAVYHIATRLSDLMYSISSGFQRTLSPVAAGLHYEGNKDKLNFIILTSLRFSVLIGSCFYLLCFILAPHILQVWLEQTDPEIILTSRIMLSSVYITILLQSTAARVLQMGGKHKNVAIATALEAVLNLTLSVILVKMYGAAGVALGTLIPNALFSFFYYLPAITSYWGIELPVYLFKTYMPMLIPILPTAALLLGFVYYIPLIHWNIWVLAGAGASAALCYFALGWFFYVNSEEKRLIRRTIPMGFERWIGWLFPGSREQEPSEQELLNSSSAHSPDHDEDKKGV